MPLASTSAPLQTGQLGRIAWSVLWLVWPWIVGAEANSMVRFPLRTGWLVDPVHL